MTTLLGSFVYLLVVRSLFLGLLLGGIVLVVSWARQHEHPYLLRVEFAFPLRGRWLRYLLAACLTPAMAYLAWMVLVILSATPAGQLIPGI